VEKVVRTICLFVRELNEQSFAKLEEIETILKNAQFLIQTKRVCVPGPLSLVDDRQCRENGILLGKGVCSLKDWYLWENLFLQTENTYLTLDMTHEDLNEQYVDLLFRIIQKRAEHTFRLSYGSHIPDSSPYFPSAHFAKEGFSIGLQSTNLSAACASLEEWLERMKAVWEEVHVLLSPVEGYLGIDGSVSPLFDGVSSLVHFVKREHSSFQESVTSSWYTKLSHFLRTENSRPVGFSGLMFPCLEDFELAAEYEQGQFSIERNLFLSLHSGLGIDTYPIGIDEDRAKVLEIFRLVQALSCKYGKPLSVRFVSDGKTMIGERSLFQNSYLKDVCIRPL